MICEKIECIEYKNDKKTRQFKTRFHILFGLSFIILTILFGISLYLVKFHLTKHGCISMYKQYPFPKFGTALYIDNLQHQEFLLSKAFHSFRYMGIENIILSKTYLETLNNDTLYQTLRPSILKGADFGITFSIYIDDIYYINKTHPWYKFDDDMDKDRHNKTFEFGTRRVANFFKKTYLLDYYLETFKRYDNLMFQSYIFGDLSYENTYTPDLPNKGKIYVEVMNAVRNNILENNKTSRSIGVNAKLNQHKIMDIIPNFADFLIHMSFHEIETFPALDYSKLNERVQFSQNLSNRYNVSTLWMSCINFILFYFILDNFPYFNAMNKVSGILFTHILQSYFPSGSILFFPDLLLQNTISPIVSFVSNNFTHNAIILQKIRHRFRQIQYCHHGLSYFDQIGKIQKLNNLVFIPRQTKNGLVGSYLVINSSKNLIQANFTYLIVSAKQIINITTTGEFNPIHKFNLSKFLFTPYSTILILLF